jgi:hypothetical protein
VTEPTESRPRGFAEEVGSLFELWRWAEGRGA